MSVEALIEKFRAVALDRVERMNTLLMQLEGDHDLEAVEALQREIHTLKGEAKMMGFADVNLVSHLTEHLILDASAAQFHVGAFVTETMFEGLDILRALFTKSPGGASAPIDLAGFVDRVSEARRPPPAAEVTSDAFDRPRTSPRRVLDGQSLLTIQASSSTRVDLARLEQLGEATGELLLNARHIGFQLTELERLNAKLGRLRERMERFLPSALVHETRTFGHEIDVWLANFRASMLQTEQWSGMLDSQTRELRHLPLEHALQHYPRAVRDLAAAQNKRMSFDLDVGGVDVDRQVLNGLSDPLLHLVRNAVDHGIERPEDRTAAGKNPQGRLTLTAEPAGDSIRVILEDDGRGIDPAIIRRKAVEKAIIDGPTAAQMSDGEALSLLFEAGFTTRDHVTDVSGRGIGMDVVRRQIGAIGGTVELDSVVGVGTKFTLVLPMSSSVSSVLAFVVDGHRFALVAKDIERVAFIHFHDLVDGTLVPLERPDLDAPDAPPDVEHVPLLDWGKVLPEITRDTPRGQLTMIFVRRGNRTVALWVDDILGEREAMTRPLGTFLSGLRICRGIAISNDGENLPLLNVNELLAAENSKSHDQRRTVRATAELPRVARTRRVLLCEDSEVTRALVSSILRDHNLQVIEAEDGWIGWEKLNAGGIDLVVTDVQMPRVDGLQLLERIRGDARFNDTPVVILTTLGEAADKERALKLGADAYLAKFNFSESELVRTVQRFLGA